MENSLIKRLYEEFPLVRVELKDNTANVKELEVRVDAYLIVLSYGVYARVLSVAATYEHPAYDEVETPECTLELFKVYKDGELTDLEPDDSQTTLIEVILTRNTIIE